MIDTLKNSKFKYYTPVIFINKYIKLETYNALVEDKYKINLNKFNLIFKNKKHKILNDSELKLKLKPKKIKTKIKTNTNNNIFKISNLMPMSMFSVNYKKMNIFDKVGLNIQDLNTITYIPEYN